MKISETALLQKLDLSEKFPRKILHAKKSQLGAGMIKTLTEITML